MAVAVNANRNKAIKFDLDQLPATHTETGDRRLGVILILVGAFFSGILSVLLVAMLVLGAVKLKEDLFLAMLLGSVLGARRSVFLLGNVGPLSLGRLECRRPVFVYIAKRSSSAGGSTRALKK